MNMSLSHAIEGNYIHNKGEDHESRIFRFR